MKILKVSTNRGGGATKAADRQAKALRDVGCVVKHLFVKQDWKATNTDLRQDGDNVFVSGFMPDYLKTDLLFQSYIVNNRTEISNTYMSLWRQESPFDQVIFDYIKQEAFDVVHFHWVSNLISSRLLKLIKTINVPIVFTGHDMNHFTGACHYDAHCGKHATNCSGCNLLQQDPFNLVPQAHQEKTNAISNVNAKFIYPSEWLNQEYISSLLGQKLGSKSSTVLRNCVDIDYFAVASRIEELTKRKELGFDHNEIIVVSGAQNNSEIRKGFEYFEYAVKQINRCLFGLDDKLRIVFVAFGGGSSEIECTHPNVRYRMLGFINEKTVRDLFQVADLLAFTSLEENFANVILEALMCATPVVGFGIGGVPDIVKHNVNGKLVTELNSVAFANALADVLLTDELSSLQKSTEKWSIENRRFYSEPYIAQELQQFYQALQEA